MTLHSLMLLGSIGGMISLREGIEAALQKHFVVDCLRRAQDGRISRATHRAICLRRYIARDTPR